MDLSKDLSSIVGDKWVSTDLAALGSYSRDHSFVTPRMPQALVKPENGREVQETIQWANHTKVPLIPVSSGEPRLRGDTVPRMGGVMVDLGRMDRIVRIDRKNRVAVIEPGVTFAQLMPELAKEGLRLAAPLLPRANKSVLASILEREPSLMPRYHWDVSDPLCCMEVVFGCGDAFRTGEAAGPGGLQGQWKIGGAQKFPLGPHQVDYHRLVQGAQGTMGIATWASIKCELVPTMKKLFFLTAQRIEDLLGFSYELTKKGYGDELFLVNNVQLAALMKGAGILQDFRKTLSGLPPWILVFCIAGGQWFPEEQIDYLEKDLKEIAQAHGQVLQNALGEVSSSRMLAVLDRPSGDSYWKYHLQGGFREIFFITTLDRSSPYVDIMFRTARGTGVPDTQIGVYLQPMVQGTSCHCEFDLYFDPDDKDEVARTRLLFERASSALIHEGAFFSRPYPSWAEEVYQTKATFVDSLKKVKSVFDPNSIMNPGKLCF